MLPSARWLLRLPRPHVRTISTRNTSATSCGRFQRLQSAYPRSSSFNKPQTCQQRMLSNKTGKHSESDSKANDSSHPPAKEPSKVEAVSNALATTPDARNNLVTPVYMPEDPNAVLKETHPAMRLLDNSAIVVQRQLEMMNVLMGFEQANRYVIMDPHGNHIGYLAERDHGLGSAVTRQMFKTHRSFTTHVFDREEKEILRFHRPFSWINSRIRVYDAVGQDGGAYTSSPELQGTSAGSLINETSASVSSLPMSDMRIIGSAEQEWAPLRRKYNLFVARQLEEAAAGTPQLTSGDLPISNSKAIVLAEDDTREIGMLQFARIDEPFLSWDFSLTSEDERLIGSVNRNFVGFARELFTDTGVYALRMDAAGLAVGSQTTNQPDVIPEHTGMTLDQRAVMLATAVSVDFDYFSRHSGSGGLLPMWPMWMPWGGGAGEAAGGAAAGEAAGAGAVGAASETGIASEVGAVVRGVGSAEGWAAGAGTMAGYEAMKGARGSSGQEVDSQSPQAADPSSLEQQVGNQQGEDIWGQESDPWAEQDDDFWGGGKGGGDGGSSSGGGGGGGGGGEGSGGGGFDFGDWF